MTEDQAKIILIESLNHSKETKVDYYFAEAKRLSVSPSAFYEALNKWYEILTDHVNQTDYSRWGTNNPESDERIYQKKTLNALHTGANVIGFNITAENVDDFFLPALLDFKMRILKERQEELEFKIRPLEIAEKQNELLKEGNFITSENNKTSLPISIVSLTFACIAILLPIWQSQMQIRWQSLLTCCIVVPVLLVMRPLLIRLTRGKRKN